jgi:hypothetical protein
MVVCIVGYTVIQQHREAIGIQFGVGSLSANNDQPGNKGKEE